MSRAEDLGLIDITSAPNKEGKPWYARLVWMDSEGGIEREWEFKTKAEADLIKIGFDEAKRLSAENSDGDVDWIEDYIIDVTQNDELIER